MTTESPLDPLFARTDIRERHEVTVRAPASVVFETARNLKIGSLWQVQGLFRIRANMMGSTEATQAMARGFVEEMLASGWGVLADRGGELFMAGAFCQPWVGDVKFQALSLDRFASFAEPDQVKIAWTLQVRPLTASTARFITETRAVATEDEARRKFRRYLAIFKVGIVAIRWVMVRAVKSQAERRWRLESRER